MDKVEPSSSPAAHNEGGLSETVGRSEKGRRWLTSLFYGSIDIETRHDLLHMAYRWSQGESDFILLLIDTMVSSRMVTRFGG